MSKKPVEKRYRSKKIVTAYEFHEGMEDGHEVRYCSPEAWEQACRDGTSVSTWSIPGPGETVEVMVPYVRDAEGGVVLTAEGEFIVNRGRMLVSMSADDFLSQYEPLE